MFGLFKKKKDKAHVLGAPAKGKAVSLKEVSDPTFSEGILGDGVAGDSIRRQNLCDRQTVRSEWYLIPFMRSVWTTDFGQRF